MDKDVLKRLEMLNQINLTEQQEEEVISFFAARDKEFAALEDIDTANTERMVHVMPIMTVVREDVVSQPYTPAQLQQGAPDVDEDYWCVPRVVE